MDDDDSEQNKKTKRKKGTSNVLQRYVAYVSDLSPIWLRRFIQINDGNNWFILGCRYNFLFNFRVLLVILYITYEALIK
jgi:hypothetical protein